MNILIMGGPGAGKGSQATLIKDYYKIAHISTGDMFREAIKNKTDLGLKVLTYTESGKLVPDSITSALVEERLQKDDTKTGFLLDGYPRTLAQVSDLDGILERLGRKIDVVLNIDVQDDLLVSRIAGRKICKDCGEGYHVQTKKSKKEGICDRCGGQLYTRADDNELTVKTRIAVYHSNTEPLLENYNARNLVVNVPGEGKITDIFVKVREALDKYDHN